jgi:hypothetical protein
VRGKGHALKRQREPGVVQASPERARGWRRAPDGKKSLGAAGWIEVCVRQCVGFQMRSTDSLRTGDVNGDDSCCCCGGGGCGCCCGGGNSKLERTEPKPPIHEKSADDRRDDAAASEMIIKQRSRLHKITPSRHHAITRHTSHVTRHTSHVTRHTSHVTRHTSHVTDIWAPE